MSNKTTIEIDGTNKGAILAINGVKSELTGLGNTVNGPLSSAMGNFAKYLPITAIASTAYGLGNLMKNAIDTADEFYKMSQKVGVSVESLSVLKYAADLSDLSMDQMQTSLKKLGTNLYDVAHGGGKEAALAFGELGINAIDLNGKAKQTEVVLLDIADKFSKMSDGTDKSALAIKLFGKAGLEMIPFLNQGKDGIEALTKEAEKLGLKISTETGKSAEQFNDTLTTFKSSLLGLANEALPPLLTKLNNFTTGVMDLNYAVQDFSGESLFQGLYRATENFQTMGIDLEKIAGIDGQIRAFIKYQKELKVHTAEVNKVFLETFGIHNQIYPLMVDNTKNENDALNNQVKLVTQLKDEYAKLIEVKAAGKPQTNAIGANGQYPSFGELGNAGFEMFPVDVNPFDPLQNNAIDFFDFTNEESAKLRDATADMFGSMSSAMGAFYNASGQKAKAFFALQKSMAIAEATMNTFNGATKALAQGGIFGFIGAAAIIATGLSYVAHIASQNPTSSGGGGGQSVGGGSSIGASSLNKNSGGSTGNYNSGQTIIYNTIVQGSIWDPGKFAREITPHINIATADGVS